MILLVVPLHSALLLSIRLWSKFVSCCGSVLETDFFLSPFLLYKTHVDKKQCVLCTLSRVGIPPAIRAPY